MPRAWEGQCVRGRWKMTNIAKSEMGLHVAMAWEGWKKRNLHTEGMLGWKELGTGRKEKEEGAMDDIMWSGV
ncbi:hypothetical protein IMZ48_07905 [Candidatus Bathyarchaeota archaeon]|nr:hypothetical protein [Candidatus Bathyarchaeota archaeon]